MGDDADTRLSSGGQRGGDTRPLSVTYHPVASLIPYARMHSDAQVAEIAASIREFGWTNPVLVDGESGIIAVHGRVLAARKLGMAHVPVIEMSGLSDAPAPLVSCAASVASARAFASDDALPCRQPDFRAQATCALAMKSRVR